jgi:hypothetical protein
VGHGLPLPNPVTKIIFLTSVLLSAQVAFSQDHYSGHTYAFWSLANPFDAPGAGMSFGGGGEAFVHRGLAVGADLAYLFPTRNIAGGVGMLSVNPAYHFLNISKRGKLVPFVTGGYSLGFRSGAGHFFNYGGGVTYWFSKNAGLRLELRDHRYIQYVEYSFVTFRVGVSFR